MTPPSLHCLTQAQSILSLTQTTQPEPLDRSETLAVRKAFSTGEDASMRGNPSELKNLIQSAEKNHPSTTLSSKPRSQDLPCYRLL